MTGASATRAASKPSRARKMRELTDTVGTIMASGTTSTVSRGITAPMAKQVADARAA